MPYHLMPRWMIYQMTEYSRLPGRQKSEHRTQQRKLCRENYLEFRRQLSERDGWICANCGVDHNLTIDHILSVTKGGKTELRNLQVLCEWCNEKKTCSLQTPTHPSMGRTFWGRQGILSA